MNITKPIWCYDMLKNMTKYKNYVFIKQLYTYNELKSSKLSLSIHINEKHMQ
jgi:hypothetical protein